MSDLRFFIKARTTYFCQQSNCLKFQVLPTYYNPNFIIQITPQSTVTIEGKQYQPYCIVDNHGINTIVSEQLDVIFLDSKPTDAEEG